jgi:hypothetical protein
MLVTETRWARLSSAEAWNRSLTKRSSRSRPTKGGLEAFGLERTADAGDDAERPVELDGLGLALQLVVTRIWPASE